MSGNARPATLGAPAAAAAGTIAGGTNPLSRLTARDIALQGGGSAEGETETLPAPAAPAPPARPTLPNMPVIRPAPTIAPPAMPQPAPASVNLPPAPVMPTVPTLAGPDLSRLGPEPTAPTLQPIAEMPSMNSRGVRDAGAGVTAQMNARRGRTASRLTNMVPRGAARRPVQTIAQTEASPYQRKTLG